MKKGIPISILLGFLFLFFFIWAIFTNNGFLKGGDITYFIALIANILIFIWGMSMVYRTQYKSQKRLILSLFILLFTWITLRFVKWLPNIYYLSMYIDYSYYIPMLGIPIIFMLLIGESFYSNIKIKDILYLIVISIAIIFIILSFTNEFHHLIYTNITSEESKDTAGIIIIHYDYGIVHYLAMAFIVILSLFDFISFAVGSRKQVSFRQIVLPIYVLLILAMYSVLYFLDLPIIRNTPFIKDFALMVTIFIATLLETLLLVGLIQNRGRYGTNFRASPIPMRIYDTKGEVAYSSINFNEKAFLEKSPEYNYIEKSLGSYVLIIEESIKEITDLKNKIEHENKNIQSINEILENTIHITEEKPSLSYRLELTQEIEENIQKEYNDATRLIQALPGKIDEENKEEVLKSLGEIALLLGYMKQKCMLLLELKRHDIMQAEAFKLLVNVIIKDISSVGFNDATYTITKDMDVRISFIILANDFINKVALHYAFTTSFFMSIIDPEKNKIIIELDDEGLRPFDFSLLGAKITFKREDTLRIIMEVVE